MDQFVDEYHGLSLERALLKVDVASNRSRRYSPGSSLDLQTAGRRHPLRQSAANDGTRPF
ncbi:MAG: hypothetical protein ABW185_22525 [Sedimenticola sp.]